MTDNEKLATERLLKARVETILTNRFYGVLVSNVEPVLSRKFPTMATDGRRHFFNPEFVTHPKMQPKHLLTVQRHESEHDARHHATRRGNRDPIEWNIACDLAINIDLHDEGMEFPPEEVLGGKPYLDPKYRGMSAEDIYRCRELDRKAEEQAKQQQQSQDEGDDEDDTAASDKSEDTGDDEADQTDDQADDGPDTDEAGDDAGDDGEGSADGEQDGDNAEGSGSGESDGDAEGEGGEGNADGQGEGESESEGNGGGGGDGKGGNGEPSSMTGDMPGGMGEVLDAAAGDPAEVSDEEAKWERVVRQAASLAKARGDLPGHVAREIERADKKPQDWREVLRAYFDAGAARVETWNRPNRRFVGSGTILPGSQREGLNTVCILVDTSGSVDDVALDCVALEAQAALDEGIIDRLVVISGDTQVNHVTEHVPGEEIDFDFKGRGGTAMRPLFDYVRENVDDASLIVCATDGYIESTEQLGEQPACPVLWAYHGYPQVVREMIANAPWGEAGIDIGAH